MLLLRVQQYYRALGVDQIFISYHHKDQKYKDLLSNILASNESSKDVSIQSGDIKKGLSDIEIKEIIRKNFVPKSRITIVLIGSETYSRKHVDWEISATLRGSEGFTPGGLIGLLLPEYLAKSHGKHKFDLIPPRLVDNIRSGYAKIYEWEEVVAPHDYHGRYSKLIDAIIEARDMSMDNAHLVDNSRNEYYQNRPLRKERGRKVSPERLSRELERLDESIRGLRFGPLELILHTAPHHG